MLKKFLKLMMVFGILLGCYFGYVHAFDTLLARLSTARKIDDVGFVVRPSKSKLEAIQRAVTSYGPDHWAAAKDLPIRYYNSDRGFWMYSQKEERVKEENGVRYDGKRIKLRPVAFIWGALDGNSTKLVTADEATIDFNQSLSFNAKGSEPLVVKYAKLEGNVIIRDDRGTPEDPSDDMVIGPLTWVDYDDDKLMVRSDSDIVIVDRNTRITGEGGPDGGMEIQLRPKAQQSKQPTPRNAGFEGAQYAKLLKNVHIITSDVGKAGIIFGPGNETAKSPNGAEVAAIQGHGQGQGADAAKAVPIPLDVKSDGPMQVDLPKPRMPVRVGPPLPPAPTLVHFTRNVVVRHGKLDELPKQLDCDNLDLTLVKSEKAPPTPKEGDDAGTAQDGAPDEAVASTATAKPEAAGSGESNNLLGGLTLQKVKATGHAVWLQMPAEGQKIRCNELLHRVASADGTEPGMTYFRGDATRKLMVEMIEFVNERPKGMEGPVERKAAAITRIWTLDATLVDNGGGMNAANLFARGPGLMETRPIQPRAGAKPDDPADRTVVWNDLFIMKNHMGPDKTIAQREMILKGQPSVVDRIQRSSLNSTDTIAIWLKPKPAEAISPVGPMPVAASASDKPGAPDQKGGFQIQKLVAIGDVHMTSETRSLTARKKLEATFEELPRIKAEPVSVASASPRPAPAAAQPAATAAATSETPAAKPIEPAMVAEADRIEATILIDPNKTAKNEAPAGTGGESDSGALFASSMGDSNSGYTIRDVRMFGGVHLHQDPPEGKVKGLDATGEVMVLRNEGPGKAIFNLYHEDPTLKTASTTATATPADPASPRRPQARVITDDQTIKGNTIGMNQVTDEAWVYGAGELTQMTDRALLSDKAEPTDDKDADAAADPQKLKTRAGKELSKRVPIVFTWGDRMLFHGRSFDPDNRSSAKIEFFKNAKAEMEDAVLFCDQVMTAYTDKPIPLADMGKLSQPSKAETANAAEAGENAEVVAAASKPDLTFLDLVGHAQVINRKVDPDRPVLLSRQKLTGKRIVYDRRSGEFLIPGEGMVYLHERGNHSTFQGGPAPSQTAANGRTIQPTSGRAGAKDRLADLVLTQIKFTEGMKGRFGTGKSTDKTETRWAEFFGANEVARAVVPNEKTPIDYDRPPPDAYFLTARTIRVVTEPPPPGSPANATGRNFLKAWENAHARTNDVSVQADVITYDSHNDLIYAHGEEGRKVRVVQQAGTGQQTSHTPAEAFRINPKTHAVDAIDTQAIQLIDTRTGTRATHVAPPDRNAKPVKPPKRLYNPPPNSIERRGFKGG